MSRGGKVGQFSTGVSYSWSPKVTVTSERVQAKRRAPAVKNLKYPYLQECAKTLVDSYWVDVLTYMSEGKLSKDFTYRGNTLTYLRGSESISLALSDNPANAALALTDFLRQYCGYSSPTDIALSTQEQENEIIPEKPWSKINKFAKIGMLADYADTVAIQEGLNRQQRQQLFEALHFACTFGFIQPGHIVIEDSQLVQVHTVCRDAEGFYITSSKPKGKPTAQDPVSLVPPLRPNPDLKKNICKWVKEVNKTKAASEAL